MSRESRGRNEEFFSSLAKESEGPSQFEVPDDQVELRVVPLTSCKKSLGTRIELIWDSKKVTDPGLRKILTEGHSVFDDRFSEGGRRVGKVVLRVQLEAGATSEEIEKAEQTLLEDLNSLIKAALSSQKTLSGVSEAPRSSTVSQDRKIRAKEKKLAGKKQRSVLKSNRGFSSARRAVARALADVQDLTAEN